MKKLNILCCNPNGGAFLYITKGWENAFLSLGHNFRRWKGTDDELKNYKPDIYLGCSGWRQHFPEWARQAYKTKIGIHVNPWGTTALKAFPGEPNINEPLGAIKWVLAQRPNFVYCYGGSHDINHIWNNWTEKENIPVVPLPTGGDCIHHMPVEADASFKCEIGFVGGCWPYKGINLKTWLEPVIRKFNSKVYGWGGWKHIGSKYKGQIMDCDVNKLFSSSIICPTICEPHTARYGIDIPERIWKVPLGGGFVISDRCHNLDKYISTSIFPMAQTPDEYIKLINYYIKNQDKRLELATKQRKEIIKNHTYHSRLQPILRQCGYNEEADLMQNFVDNMIKDMQ